MCVLMQGLADTFIILGMAFDSPEAKQLNKDIFECIYYHALTTSSALAKVDGELSASGQIAASDQLAAAG
jgi:ribonucleotide reductase alpha subunit